MRLDRHLQPWRAEASVIRYEAAVKADGFLVMAHLGRGIARAKTILETAAPSEIEVHKGAKVYAPAEHLVPAGGRTTSAG